jgi:hypothetical protein
MKRKNLFFVSALILFGLANVNSAMAEDVPAVVPAVSSGESQKSDVATVNIIFRPIQSIVVNPAQKNVNLLYATKDNYANGVTAEMTDHLEVFSTGGFAVTANTDGDFKRSAGGFIPAADVILKATQGTSTIIGSFSNVTLSTNPQTLITAAQGGRALKYTVAYNNTGGASDAYIDKYIKDDATESVYTATVTYTIATN